MQPIRYFLHFDEAVRRLKNKNTSLRWKIHYAKQLIESCHIIIIKEYDKMLDEIFLDALHAHSTQKRVQFSCLSPILRLYSTLVRSIAPYHDQTAFLANLAMLFEEADTAQQQMLSAKLRNDSGLKELFENLQYGLNGTGTSKGVDFRNIVQLVKNHYNKSVLFQEEK